MKRSSTISLPANSSALPPENLAESFFHKLSQPIGALYASLELGLMSDDAMQLRGAIEAGLIQLERLRWLFQAAREFFATDFCARARKISIRECVRAAVNDSKPLAESKRVCLSVFSEHDAQVLADPVYLRDALENLLSRCIRNSADGDDIKISVATEDNKASITICDESRFDAQTGENVFEPFPPGVQVGPSTPGNLDLALSQKIVRAFGGELVLRATQQGTNCFQVALPRQDS